MPRPPKKGLHYFPKDTDFYEDYKIIELLSEYGPAGVLVYEYLLTRIYREGYCLELPIDKAALLAVRAIGSRWIKKEFAISVIHYCGDIGLFRVDLLKRGVITSSAIQRRYQEVKTTLRHKFQKDKYWILDENDEEVAYPLLSAPKNADKCTETGDKCTETNDNCTFIDTKEKKNKEKKSKEKESKENRSGNTSNTSVAIDELTERFGGVLAPVVADWLTYKQERREAYKPTGLKSLLTRIEKELDAYGEQAVADVIQLAMSNGWKGIAWDRLQPSKEKQQSQRSQRCESANPFLDPDL